LWCVSCQENKWIIVSLSIPAVSTPF
jgi:hypothetical protein